MSQASAFSVTQVLGWVLPTNPHQTMNHRKVSLCSVIRHQLGEPTINHRQQ